MDVARIDAILLASKGEVHEKGYPAPGTEVIDVWFEVALLSDKVREHEQEMIELLREWPESNWDETIPPLGMQIDHLTLGAVLGNHDSAVLLLAFGKLLGWWTIFSPSSLGLTKDNVEAQLLVTTGMLYISGYAPEGVPAV